jgi:SNF2 family DNA or RNA helicase
MGLGKTFQVTAFLTAMLRNRTIDRVLIISPVSVLESWKRELEQHLRPHVARQNNLVIEVAGAEMNKKKRISVLKRVFDSHRAEQHIIVSSYHLVANMVDEFAMLGKWDYVRR